MNQPLPSALLPEFLEVYPFQPATALWRAVEIAVLIRQQFPQGKGLDLGCGDGLLTEIVFQHCGARELVGIDPDPAEVELARARGIYQELFVTGGGALPLENDSFDFVLSNSVLEHIPDVKPVLADAARVLKTGGTFLATVPAPDFHVLLRGALWKREQRKAYLSAVDARCAHFYYWDAEKWKQELERVGLQLEVAQPYLSRFQTRRWEAISRLTAGVLSALTGYKKHPIEIQRSLGMRTPGKRMPAPLARLLAVFLTGGAAFDRLRPRKGSCLLIRAVKVATP